MNEDDLNGLDHRINDRGFFERQTLYGLGMNTTGGMCECGCGNLAPISSETNRSRGYVKGESRRFISGHQNKGRVFSDEHREAMSAARKGKGVGEANPMYGKTGDANPFFGRSHSEESRLRMSQAHVGKVLSLETRTKMSDSRRAEKNGRWVGDGVSYNHLHQWLLKNFRKTGVCSSCQSAVGNSGHAGTQWANTTGIYSRDIQDYRELCPSCHKRFDLERPIP